MIRLGYHYHYPVQQKASGLYTIGHIGRFIDSLALQCKTLILFLHPPSPTESPILDYRIVSTNIQWVNIRERVSAPLRQVHSFKYTQWLQHYRKEIDALLIRGPTPLLPAFAASARKLRLPVAFLLGGDYLQGVGDLTLPFWRKSLIAIWATQYEIQQYGALRKQLVFVNSPQLFTRLKIWTKNIHQVQTTTLSEDDFFFRKDTCVGRSHHLLFTGRMSKSKGIYQIISAVSRLIACGEDIYIDFVGPFEKDESPDDLLDYAKRLGIAERVHYHGYKTVGEELFSYYRKADIYVIASLSSEGFPRTIWEAMAHGLPVVATRVGGIPGFIEGKAELIEPFSIDELVSAIQRLLHNQPLRQKYIEAGYSLTKANTLANQATKITNVIEKQLRG